VYKTTTPGEEEARDATLQMDRRWILYALAFVVTSSVSGVGASSISTEGGRFSHHAFTYWSSARQRTALQISLSLTLFSPPTPTPSLRLARVAPRPNSRRRFIRKRTRRGVHLRGVVGAGRAFPRWVSEGQVRHPKYGGHLFSNGVRRFRANRDEFVR
jgi:hypothetical protein